ncbi:nucleotidyltransferase domain-containing protein [Salipaludibacillus sp. CF4.18]|uniref:nucleotidyltransferase domain-containing protein n=1 Tax=Salipaludibacillus sp. CF4.18 TaxID=3373081 RepID=UPI003EE806AF
MNKRSLELMDIAKNYIYDSNCNISHAFVSGSVARGEADEFSDVDITLYSKDRGFIGSKNIEYRDEILQIDKKPLNKLPTKRMVMESPWDYRFLVESIVIIDTNNQLKNIQTWVKDYLFSEEGRQKQLDQVTDIVTSRTMFAKSCLKEKRNFSATCAAMGAWSEAALLYLFFQKHSVSNDRVIPHIHQLCGHYQEFESAVPFNSEVNAAEFPEKMTEFRKYLRVKGHSFEFGLSPIQDRLCGQKALRLLYKEETLSLKWQLYGEAFWLFMETSNGLALEPYYRRLPPSLQDHMSDIGFQALSDKKVLVLCSLSGELLHLSQRRLLQIK